MIGQSYVSPAPRTVLGPARCKTCGEEVVYEMLGSVRLGWLHADGTYHCTTRPTGLSRREYNRLWMRRKRAAA